MEGERKALRKGGRVLGGGDREGGDKDRVRKGRKVGGREERRKGKGVWKKKGGT